MWKIGIECGQSFFRLSSWIDPIKRKHFFRTFPPHPGFAIGPVMVYKEDI